MKLPEQKVFKYCKELPSNLKMDFLTGKGWRESLSVDDTGIHTIGLTNNALGKSFKVGHKKREVAYNAVLTKAMFDYVSNMIKVYNQFTDLI